MITGWISEAQELPVSQHLRSVAEILNAPPTAAERRQLKREQDEQARRRADVADAASAASARGFIAAMNGTPPRDVLAEAAREPFRDREQAARRRAAIDVLRPLGLADVISGYQSGTVWDYNMGELQAPQDESARAAMDRQYVFERSQREAEERTRAVDQARVQLRARLRSRGLGGAVSHRSRPAADADRLEYERACAEIGCAPDGLRYR